MQHVHENAFHALSLNHPGGQWKQSCVLILGPSIRWFANNIVQYKNNNLEHCDKVLVHMYVCTDGYGGWSSDGCTTVNSSNSTDNASSEYVTCMCNHLTNFAILLVRITLLYLYTISCVLIFFRMSLQTLVAL